MQVLFEKMDVSKFYSYDELKTIILANSVHRLQLSSTESSVKAILDTAYVESVIQAQYAVGNLRCGEKNGERYYAKI